jgi:hypothetical protein
MWWRRKVRQVDDLGRSQLHYAAADGDAAAVKKELAGGAEVNGADARGWTPLHFAAQAQSAEIVRMLVKKGAKVDAPDGYGNTPLLRAVFAYQGDAGTIEALRAAGADAVRKNNGVSPVSLARTIANYDVAKCFADIPAEAATGAAGATEPADKPADVARQGRPVEKSYNWKKEQARLWDSLVPKSGRAATLQGELIRLAGKLTDEAYRNGNDNWEDDCAAMWRFVAEHLEDPETFSKEQLAGIRQAVETIIRDHDCPDVSGDGSPYYLLSERVIDWCMAHPDPLPLPESGKFTW